MMKEFPNKDKMQPVGRVRSWYNTGRYGFGNGDNTKNDDAHRSVGYDAEGNPKRGGGLEAAREAKKAKAAKKPAKKAKAAKAKAKKAAEAAA